MKPFLVRRAKLFEQIADHLQKEIVEGRLKPGDRLPPERELCSVFGVGRPAIREALVTLERGGLVETGNGAPARVATPDAHRILTSIVPSVQLLLLTESGQRQLQNLRQFVEMGWARHAAAHATAEQVADLKAALDANFAALGDREAYILTDVRFHYMFAEFIGNPVLVAVHNAMSMWLHQQRRVALQEPYDDRAGFLAHVRIYEAVAARDPDAAEAAMRDHLEAGVDAFWARFAAKPKPSAS